MRLPASEQYHIEAIETQHTIFSQQSRTENVFDHIYEGGLFHFGPFNTASPVAKD
jgi:hypothetical protein